MSGTARSPFETSPDASLPGADSGLGSGDGDTQDDADAATSSECDLTGTFAFLADMDVSWSGTSIGGFLPVVAAGSGKLTIATLLEIKRSGDELFAHVKACGAEVPTFASDSLGESYLARFPTTLWDARTMPAWQLKVATECLETGCSMSTDTLYAMIGVDMDNPGIAWPSSRTSKLLRFPDHDSDGYPGVTLTMAHDGGNVYPPVSLPFFNRAKELMLGIRITTRFDGVLGDCDHFGGEGPGSKVETRAATCMLDKSSGASTECSHSGFGSVSEVDFLDGNLPTWTVNATKWTGIRVPSDATCSDIRAVEAAQP